MSRTGWAILAAAAITTPCLAQDGVVLAEAFAPGHSYRVEVEVKTAGRLGVPTGPKTPPRMVATSGVSRLSYDERVLPADEPGAVKTVRAYREVDFRRLVGGEVQDTGIRPSVRRMVVIRSGDRKAPFSPDGPLTWNEIDVVAADVFCPATVTGLLSAGAVRPGQGWTATPAAVAELTNITQVEQGGLGITYVGPTTVGGRKVARLRMSGSVRGVDKDGPCVHRLEGTAYFDMDGRFLSYLSIKGTHDLLDGNGQTAGQVEGQFVMTRTVTPPPPGLSDAGLAGVDTKPGTENTLLLYDNPAFGLRLLYPRGWRVGAVQGRQLTLDHTRGGAGILITVEPTAKLPTTAAYRGEVTGFLQREKAAVSSGDAPIQIRPAPAELDRFGLDAAFGTDKVRMEYAVIRQPDGGATVAARLPAVAAAELRPEVERIVRGLAVTRKITE